MSLCECPICGAKRNNLTSHITKTHKIKKEDFLKQYPNTKLISEETFNKLSDEIKRNWQIPELAEKYSSYWHSEEHGKNVSERMKKTWEENPEKYTIPIKEGIKNAMENGDWSEVHSKSFSETSQKLWNDPEYRKKHRQYGRNQMLKNLQNPSYGRNRARYLYNGIYYRSSWEISFVKYAEKNNIQIKYECMRFKYSYNDIEHTYLPDFYLPEYNFFIEIKPQNMINELTDVKCESVKKAGYKIYYITDISDEGLNSQLVPLFRNE